LKVETITGKYGTITVHGVEYRVYFEEMVKGSRFFVSTQQGRMVGNGVTS
jgi:hypothetical protein